MTDPRYPGWDHPVTETEPSNEAARYLAQAATHLLDHLAAERPAFYCEDTDNVRHFAGRVLAVPYLRPRSPAILVYALVSLVAFGAGLVVGLGVGRL